MGSPLQLGSIGNLAAIPEGEPPSHAIAIFIFKFHVLSRSTVVSKSSPDSDSIERNYVVSVEQGRVIFDYLPDTLDLSSLQEGSQRYRTVIVDGVSLPAGAWHHVAITVYAEDAAVYVDGTVEGVQALEGKMVDANRTVLLGQTSNGKVSHFQAIVCTLLIHLFHWQVLEASVGGWRACIYTPKPSRKGLYTQRALAVFHSDSLGRCKSCTKEVFHSVI